MTISRLEYELDIDGTTLSPTGGSITLDESWSPAVDGQVLFAIPEQTVIDDLDPRTGARVTLTMTQYFETETGIPYNTSGARTTRTRSFDLGVRTRSINYVNGTLSLEIASDEMLLQDETNRGTTSLTPASNTIYDAVTLALDSIGATYTAEADDVALEADSTEWEPGQSAWDYIKPLVDAAGLRLYCSAERNWFLHEPQSLTGQVLTFTEATLKQLNDTLSRDDRWFDAVHITYRWRDASDVEHVEYDIAQEPGSTKVYAVEYERPKPGPFAASTMLERTRGRGRIQDVTTVMDPTARPGAAMQVTAGTAPIQTGFVSGVSFDLATDEMTIRSRDLTSTPPSAWVLLPAGEEWQDSPVGESWADETI